MSLLNLLTKEKNKTPSETKEIGPSFPMIQKIQKLTHRSIMDVLLKKPLDSIASWFKKKIDTTFPGLMESILPSWNNKTADENETVELPAELAKMATSNPSESQSLPDTTDAPPQSSSPSGFEAAEKTEQEHMGIMAKEFEILSNQYRKSAGLQRLQPNDQLIDLAGKVCDQQVEQGGLEHTSEEFRKQNQIHGEILVSGFSSAREALEKFINSPTHYVHLMGNFTEIGYAIRPGIEKKSGEKMYFLAVVYRGGRPLDHEKQVPKKALMIGEPESGTPQTLEEAVQKKPVLQAHFDALRTEMQRRAPDVTLELGTSKLTETERKRGSFWVTFKKGQKHISYLVTSTPPLLNRPDKDGKLLQVSFPDVLSDLEQAPSVNLEPASEKKPSESPDGSPDEVVGIS